MKNYDEVSVIKSLSRKASIRINSVNKSIEVVKDATDVGNGSWGKIDYLCKVHGYFYIFVRSVDARKQFNNLDDNTKKSKAAKRENKLNMAAMTKNAMKKVKFK